MLRGFEHELINLRDFKKPTRAIDQCPPAHFLGKEVWPESGCAEISALSPQCYDCTVKSPFAMTEFAIKEENLSPTYLPSASSID